MLLSIIIKTLNEEIGIKGAIESALQAIAEIGGDGEVILADSISTDRTIEIATSYPIKIVQLMLHSDRSCGIGAELGYRFSSGKYIYILDGDMRLSPGFIDEAIRTLENFPSLAGVAGLVEEMVVTNSAMAGRKAKAENSTPASSVSCLNMGGLYRRSAIEKVGYLTNRNLHSFEEFELGLRLHSAGWDLKRINVQSIKHFGPDCSSIKLLCRRWKTLYACGNGELFRAAWSKPYFLNALMQLRVYRIQLAVLIVWIGLIFNLFLNNFTLHSIGHIFFLWVAIFIYISIAKRSLARGMYSIAAWHVGVFGFFKGIFIKKNHKPTDPIAFLVVKTD